MDLRGTLQARAPQLYRQVVIMRHRQARVRDFPKQLAAMRAFRRHDFLLVDIDQTVGMGGLLVNAAMALQLGEERECTVRLRFTSPTYMPEGAIGDWLDRYFLRIDDSPAQDFGPRISSRHIARRHVPPFEQWGPLVWSVILIRPEIQAVAAPFMVGDYAAVHYRGSDKFLEAGRVEAERVLDTVAAEMKAAGLSRLFVASDEPTFIELAVARFGADATFTLPVEAVAVDGVPPHMSDVPGEVKAREALAIMLILSGAKVCVRTESFLSAWAQTLADETSRFVLVSA